MKFPPKSPVDASFTALDVKKPNPFHDHLDVGVGTIRLTSVLQDLSYWRRRRPVGPEDLRQIDRFIVWGRFWVVAVGMILAIGYWQGVLLSAVYSLLWMHAVIVVVCLDSPMKNGQYDALLMSEAIRTLKLLTPEQQVECVRRAKPPKLSHEPVPYDVRSPLRELIDDAYERGQDALAAAYARQLARAMP